MNTIEAIALAIVEGLTEFLPISSTGHMILAQAVGHIQGGPFTKVFLINIQFGAILSVLVLYYKRFLDFKSFDFYIKLLIAFIPAAILGLALNKIIDSMLESVTTVAISMIVGGLVILWVDKHYHDRIIEPDAPKRDEDAPNPDAIPDLPLSYLQSLMVGLCQTIAMIPGVSRSAATIIGGLTQGLRMKQAAEFSFFLAVPTIAAAAAYKTLKGWDDINGSNIPLLVLGNIIAFVVGMIAIKSFVDYISRKGMKAFGYYRIIVGIAILIALYVLHLPLEILK
jgi:undecaprenyl-diphosphatase